MVVFINYLNTSSMNAKSQLTLKQFLVPTWQLTDIIVKPISIRYSVTVKIPKYISKLVDLSAIYHGSYMTWVEEDINDLLLSNVQIKNNLIKLYQSEQKMDGIDIIKKSFYALKITIEVDSSYSSVYDMIKEMHHLKKQITKVFQLYK